MFLESVQNIFSNWDKRSFAVIINKCKIVQRY